MKWRWRNPELMRRMHDNRLLAAALDGRLRVDELPPDVQDDVRVSIARRMLADRVEGP